MASNGDGLSSLRIPRLRSSEASSFELKDAQSDCVLMALSLLYHVLMFSA